MVETVIFVIFLSYLSDLVSGCDFTQHSYPIQNICSPQQGINDSICQPNWCDSRVRYNVIHSNNGTVELQFDPPPSGCNYDCFLVRLFVLEGVKCDVNMSDDFIVDNMKDFTHTVDCIKINRSQHQTNCSQSIKIVYNYIFSGCYKLSFRPNCSEYKMSCRSPFFHITTNYTKDLIPDPTINLVKVDKHNVEIQNLWDLKHGGATLDCVITTLTLRSNTHHLAYHCVLDSTAEISFLNSNDDCEQCQDCDVFNNNETCKCMWTYPQKGRLVNCRFNNVRNGTYKIDVAVRDVRCRDTLWRKHLDSSYRDCQWHSDIIQVNVPDNYSSTIEYNPEKIAFIKYYMAVLIISVIAILISIFSAILVYCRCCRTNRTWYHIVPYIVPEKNNRNKTVDKNILLLYPRDCAPFMQVMEIFRNLLQSAEFQVYDPFDEEIYDEVASTCNTWGLKHLSDPTVKVILAASWCSLKLEEGVLSSNPVTHVERLPFDTIFTSLLNQLYLEDLPYKKIFVIRLDCDDAWNLHYKHIASNRNFTLPQSFHSLIHHLLELSPEESISLDDKHSQIRKLDESIKSYNDYLRDNPRYLETFISNDLQRICNSS